MTRILGIDPGSIRTGFGVIEISRNNHAVCLTHGHISCSGNEDVCQRLLNIHRSLVQVVENYQPHEVSVEQVFMNRNVQSALKLGQARGAALVATAQFGLPVFEYSPRTIKQSVAGYGAAEKHQIQHMIRLLLKMPESVQSDAADALAAALCHCYHRRFALKIKP
jgi:crossover junction endodeoxyribonuclease RuvC